MEYRATSAPGLRTYAKVHARAVFMAPLAPRKSQKNPQFQQFSLTA
jgi:hypothetical protein